MSYKSPVRLAQAFLSLRKPASFEGAAESNEALLQKMNAFRRLPAEGGVLPITVTPSLAEFIKGAWPIIEPNTPYVHNWHIEALCLHLAALHGTGPQADTMFKRLLVNIPPGHMKSLIVNVLWPAWVWLHDPAWTVIFATYPPPRVSHVSYGKRFRQLVESEWYAALNNGSWVSGQSGNRFYTNKQGGWRIALDVCGALTGYRASAIVVDYDGLPPDEDQRILDWYEALRGQLDTAEGVELVVGSRVG